VKTGKIPSVGLYRGQRLHSAQSEARLQVERAEIDEGFALVDIAELFRFAQNERKAPEARLAAGALIKARWKLATDDRRARPNIDLELVDATVGALDGEYWRSPTHYGSLFDHDAVPRETPLTDD